MNSTETLKLAKAYVALSNAHQLDAIQSLFAGNAIYKSNSVGIFEGRNNIINMMSGFFTRFPDVYWSVDKYQLSDANTVEFKFLMTAIESDTATVIERRGLETIQINTIGEIVRIDVEVSDT